MRRCLVSAGALAAALLCIADPAAAQAIEPGSEGRLAELVPPKDGARACYTRAYDAKHLQDHPKQKVTGMQFRLAYHIFEPDEFFPKGQRNYYFQLDAKLRGGARKQTAAGECSITPTGKIFCGVECDGGGVIVSQKSGRLLVDLEAVGRLRMTLFCDGGEEDSVDLLPGEDDKAFLLEPIRMESCPAYDDW